MTRAFFSLIIFVILFSFFAVFQQIRELYIFLSYNALFFIDGLFSFSKGINPLVAWTLTLALVGLIVGFTKSLSTFQLHKKFYTYSFLGCIIILLLISKCSKPLNYNSSKEVHEEMLWSNLIKKKSYSICSYYITEFPKGKHISEIKLMQESLLWDSASVSRSSKVWELYCDKFKRSVRYPEARISYDKLLWNELSKVNTSESYRAYLNVFPNGLYSKFALKKLNKNTYIDKPKISAVKKNELSSQSVPETNSNEQITISDNNTPNESVNNNSNDNVNKLNLVGGIRYEGAVKNNLPNGYGREYFADNSNLRGFYVNGKREGEFIFTRNDGSEEKQIFKNGIRVNQSTPSSEGKSPQTSNYIGSRKNGTGLPHGLGKEIFPDGTSLSGNYIDGKRDGEFIYTSKDGTKEKQFFNNGVRIK